MSRVLLLRHGAVDDDVGLLGRREVALSETGRRQARLWGRALADAPPCSFVTSPLGRCHETAGLLAETAGWQVSAVAESAVAEIDLGAFDGLTRQAIDMRYPGAWAARGRDFAGFRPPGGESFADVAARVGPWLDRVAALEGDVLAVTHGGIIRVAVCLLLGLGLQRVMDLGVARGGLTILELGQGRRLAALNLPAGCPLPGGIAPGAAAPAAPVPRHPG